MSNIVKWNEPICWPSGKSAEGILDPKVGGTSLFLLNQEEVLPQDCLNREKTAHAIINFIGKNKKGYILNLDSAWGSGKTWFTKRIFLEIKNIHPACYIDAWEHDYKKDPIYIILNSIINELEKHKRSSVTDKIYNSSFWRFSKSIAPELIKALTRVDVEKISESYTLSGKNTAVTDLAGAATKYVLDKINAEEKAIHEIKLLLAELIDETPTYESVITNSTRRYPLVIIVDELDRCRPDFAVEMLEAVKHIFNIPNIFFIISTHSDELHHSIKSIYGEGFSSENDLEKFFNSKLTLSEPNICNFIEMHLSNNVKTSFSENKSDLLSYEIKNLIAIIEGISIYYEIPLRRIQKLLIELDAIIKIDDREMGHILLTPLLCVIFLKRELPLTYSILKDKARAVNRSVKGSKAVVGKINEKEFTRTKSHSINLSLGINGTSRYVQEIGCSFSDQRSIQIQTVLSTIINALHSPIENTELQFMSDDPKYSADRMLEFSYGISFNFAPQINKYINLIEFGGSFD